MAAGFHPPLEEYLEAIYSLSEEGAAVIQARLAERLGHSAQTVSETVHRLIAGGYLVKAGKGRDLQLTTQGRLRAESVVRRHRLAERFLVEIVGLPWHRAHIEAGRWEHVLSDDVEARFDEILGHPRTCPHGNPIPGAPADPSPPRQFALSEGSLGASVRLVRITEQIEIDHDALRYLSEVELVPGRNATLRTRTPDGATVLELHNEDGTRGQTIAIDAKMCEQLFVVDADDEAKAPLA